MLFRSTCIVNANQSGDTNWNAATQVQQVLAVGKGSQWITITSTAPGIAFVGGATYTIAATATSGLSVTFTSGAPSICTVSGSTVSFIAVGTCIVIANQSGDTNWNAATQGEQSFEVGKGSQTISFTTTVPAFGRAGGPAYVTAASATSGLAVTITIDEASAPVCTLMEPTVRFRAPGNCIVNANQPGNANYNAAPQTQQTISVRAKGLDFNIDGFSDILWRHAGGAVAAWLMNGSTLIAGPLVGGAPTNWLIAGTGDFDGDGKSDILWRGPNGEVAIWFLNGTTLVSGPLVGSAPLTWTIASVGDFNDDGKGDILWRGPGGEVAIWFLNGGVLTSGPLVAGAPLSWLITGNGDLNGDGKNDIIWRGPNGEVAAWLLNGAELISGPLIGSATSDWTIAAPK